MKSAVTVSVMALRALWLLNLGLGAYVGYIATGDTKAWTIIHVFTGIVIVALVWFLGVAQALVKGGSLALTLITFIVGLGVTLIGMAQVATPPGAGLVAVQALHIAFTLAAIVSGEICGRRYRVGRTGQAA